MNELIGSYLASKVNAWRPLTIKATASRLKHYSSTVSPDTIFKDLKTQGAKPYYRKQVFVSMCAYQDWLIAQGRATSNQFRAFMKSSAQLFRNVYEDKYTSLTWEEFQNELSECECSELKSALALMAYGACRLSEVYTYDPQSRTVLGKGQKRRYVHVPEGTELVAVSLTPRQIRARLRYNPHAYRKLAADKYLRGGLDIKTVQVLLGHSSLLSTQRYLRPMQNDELKVKLEQQVWRTA
jgi:integrase